MKKLSIYLLAFMSVLTVSCKKQFLEDMRSYDKLDETMFTNEVQTGWYIDRLYNYFFAAYRSPIVAESTLGNYDDAKTKMTEEFGGTVGNYINPNKTLQLATEADAYYGGALTASVSNTPYTRIRFCNLLIERMDSVGQSLPEAFRKTAKGQMYFLRGWQYFNLVRRYGGVPIELKVREASQDDVSIRTPRSKASEVFAQM
ncbi:MAG TPA: RagB/SusD family nutrient uptake outer membrane protein, partial [Ferruginibacter sp.]|nr:RagB/SusD family nutrient uptake outer membrane protein [Ferruginibacter sp.]